VGEAITLPFWAVAALAALAAFGLVQAVLRPLIQWIAERRRNRRIERLNRDLVLPVSRFKLAPRRSLIDQLLHLPEIDAAIDQEAKQTGEPRAKVERRARGYAREIVPAFSTTVYFRIGTRLARWLSNYLFRVRVAANEREALAGVDPKATVVFVMNHRSNLDYVLVTHLAAGSSAISYAVGEWARVPVLASLIRLMGGYFIRRDSGNPLYRRVLQGYVRLATDGGVTQAVFPEGGLSRSGALQEPKLGLLSYICGAYNPTSGRDIVFVPVGLNYDRVLEDRILLAAGAAHARGERPRFKVRLGPIFGFLVRTTYGRGIGRTHRNGYACVSFGRPQSLAGYLSHRAIDLAKLTDVERHQEIRKLGDRLLSEIGRAVPALPVSLVATALLEAGEPLSAFELKGWVHDVMRRVERSGAPLYIPRADQDYAIDFGVKLLETRRLIEQRDGLYHIPAGEAGTLGFYANPLVHHLGIEPWPTLPETTPPTIGRGIPPPPLVASTSVGAARV
jgi:glycerol-3-phosphate O-acyltransferase